MQEELQSAAVALPTIESVTADALSDKDFLLIPGLSTKICQCPDQNCKVIHDYVQSGGVLVLTSVYGYGVDVINSLFGFSVVGSYDYTSAPPIFDSANATNTPFTTSASLPINSHGGFTSLPEGAKSIYHMSTTHYIYDYTHGTYVPVTTQTAQVWTVQYGSGSVTVIAHDWSREDTPEWDQILWQSINSSEYSGMHWLEMPLTDVLSVCVCGRHWA